MVELDSDSLALSRADYYTSAFQFTMLKPVSEWLLEIGALSVPFFRPILDSFCGYLVWGASQVSVIAVLVTLLIRSVTFAVLAPVDGQKGAKKGASAAPKWTDAKKRKRVAADCWLTMLKLPLPLDVYKKVTHILLAAISYCPLAWTHWSSFAWI